MYLLQIVLILVGTLTLSASADAQARLRLATTTSTDDSGLLDVLLPPFEKMYDARVEVIAVGTGKALKIAQNGDVDVVLVHARALEDRFIRDGFGVDRRDVMYNDFVIVGPAADPGQTAASDNATEAVTIISSAKAIFVSRGDESGTHQKEKTLWSSANIAPEGTWYLEVGQGMGATLRIADEKQAYCLVDRGTYLALKEKVDLEILVEGDPILYNPYGIIAVNPTRWPHVNYALATALMDWVTSEQGRKIIGDYSRNGDVLFKPSVRE
ncbi:MAG: tungsten ABC transporter substrate-binding protein [Candidatus Latescibacteria bacterium]|nr:tungsten ABC transporter substrate-binding protein [Candidatus Latescibacterota bacterium]